MASSTPIGKYIGRLSSRANVPMITESGRFFSLSLRMPAGAATASEIIRGTVYLDYKFI